MVEGEQIVNSGNVQQSGQSAGVVQQLAQGNVQPNVQQSQVQQPAQSSGNVQEAGGVPPEVQSVEGAGGGEKKSKALLWIILSVVVVLILVGAVGWMFLRGGNDQEKIIAEVRYLECVSQCPVNALGAGNMFDVFCMNSCVSYVATFIDEEAVIDGGPMDRFARDCVSGMREDIGFDYASCMNTILVDYPDVDVSDVVPEYEVYDWEIMNLTCMDESADVNVNLISGSVVNGVVLVFEGVDGTTKIVERDWVEGEMNNYLVDYTVEGIDMNVTRVGAALNVGVDEIRTEFKMVDC